MNVDERAQQSAEAVRRARRSLDLSRWSIPGQRMRTSRPGWAFLAGVLATALILVPLVLLGDGNGPGTDVGEGVSTPPATIVPGGGFPAGWLGPDDSEAAKVWETAVTDAAADLIGENGMIVVGATQRALTDAGGVSAVVEPGSSGERIVFNFQAWDEGEYQDDPEWIAKEGAGSNTPGKPIPKGTLFIYDGPLVTHATLVSPYGSLLVFAENTVVTGDRLAAIAVDLIDTANALTDPSGS